MRTTDTTTLWSYQVHRSRGRTTVALAGEIDLTAADALRCLLMAQISPGGIVEVDVAGVTFIDLCAIARLVEARRAAVAAGCRLTLLHAGAHLRRILRITGALTLLSTDPAG